MSVERTLLKYILAVPEEDLERAIWKIEKLGLDPEQVGWRAFTTQ